MSFWNSFKIAFVALQLNALRSFLTMLGIIIGVASVIVMVAVSSGAKQEVENMINALGTHMLMIRPGAGFRGGRRSSAGSDTPFSEKDLKTILEQVPFVESASGSLQSLAPLVLGNTNWQTTIQGVHASYLGIRDWVIEDGRGISEREVKAAAKVAVVGQTIITKLFNGQSPLNQHFRIKNVPFTVIGTLQEKGQSSFGSDQDDVIMIPISTSRLRIGGRTSTTVSDEVGTLFVAVDPSEDIAYAEAELEDFLRRLRKLKPGQEDNFSVSNIAEFIRARNETANTMGLLLAATAAISLLVGGIGIMNIMLVSVTERTREIGLRLAIGAKQADILRQFLIEAITLCLIGSIIGVTLGVGSALGIAAMTKWAMLISPAFTLVAIAAAAIVGIFFGYYPARKASRMNPIDALRHE